MSLASPWATSTRNPSAPRSSQKRRIETTYLDGPFRHMQSHWQFHPDPGGCRAEFYVDFEMKNALLQRVVGVFFGEAMSRIVAAFESRAEELCG